MTFLPYIGEHFAKQYIVPLYIGESVSSTVPSLIVFLQGNSEHENTCDLASVTPDTSDTLEVSFYVIILARAQ